MRFSSDFEPNSDSCDFFLSGRISALSCVVCHAVYRGEQEAISLARQAIEPVDPYCRTKIQGAELDPQVGGGD